MKLKQRYIFIWLDWKESSVRKKAIWSWILQKTLLPVVILAYSVFHNTALDSRNWYFTPWELSGVKSSKGGVESVGRRTSSTHETRQASPGSPACTDKSRISTLIHLGSSGETKHIRSTARVEKFRDVRPSRESLAVAKYIYEGGTRDKLLAAIGA